MWNKLIWKFTTIRQLFSVWNNQNFLVKYRNFVQRRLSFVMWRHDFNRAFVVIWNICQGWPIALPTSLSLSVWRQSQWLHNLQQRERKTALILIMLPFLLLRSWWHAIFALRIFLSFFSFSFFTIRPFSASCLANSWRQVSLPVVMQDVNEPNRGGGEGWSGKAARGECSCPYSCALQMQTWENSNCSDLYQFALECKKWKRETKLTWRTSTCFELHIQNSPNHEYALMILPVWYLKWFFKKLKKITGETPYIGSHKRKPRMLLKHKTS